MFSFTNVPGTGSFHFPFLFLPQRLSLAVQDSMALANEVANEVVSGIQVVRSFNTEKHEVRRYDDRLMQIHTLKTRRDTVRAVYLLARRVRSFLFFCKTIFFVDQEVLSISVYITLLNSICSCVCLFACL